MLLEELYNIDMLNQFQRQVYTELIDLLRPYDESQFDHFHTSILVRYLVGIYSLHIVLKPAGAEQFSVTAIIGPEDVLLTLGKWSEKFRTQNVHEFLALLQAIFHGRVKIVEEQASGRAYRWTRYDLLNGAWQQHSHRSAILYNYLGKKTRVERFCALV